MSLVFSRSEEERTVKRFAILVLLTTAFHGAVILMMTQKNQDIPTGKRTSISISVQPQKKETKPERQVGKTRKSKSKISKSTEKEAQSLFAQKSELANDQTPTSLQIGSSQRQLIYPGQNEFSVWRNQGTRDIGSSFQKKSDAKKFDDFIENIMSRLSVPERFEELYSKANGVLTLSKNTQTNEWKIARVEGNSYVNAILYQTFSEALLNDYIKSLMGVFSASTFQIALNFSKSISDRGALGDTKSYDIKSRRLSYSFVRLLPPAERALTHGGLNILAAGMYLYNKVNDKWVTPKDIKALQLSEGFANDKTF